jgi:hypothetical protein
MPLHSQSNFNKLANFNRLAKWTWLDKKIKNLVKRPSNGLAFILANVSRSASPDLRWLSLPSARVSPSAPRVPLSPPALLFLRFFHLPRDLPSPPGPRLCQSAADRHGSPMVELCLLPKFTLPKPPSSDCLHQQLARELPNLPNPPAMPAKRRRSSPPTNPRPPWLPP